MTNNNTYNAPEKAIKALELELGVQITVIDYEGLFHSRMGSAILDFERQSHRKLPTCQAGFCNKKCRENCRYNMNTECLRNPKPFTSICWKSLEQIIIPLRIEDRHCGMLYAGNWKSRQTPPKGLPKEFYRSYEKLDYLSAKRRESLLPVIEFFARGLILTLHEIGALESSDVPRATRIASFIRNNAAQGIQLSDLSTFLNISNSRTSILVNSLFGKSFTTLLTEERMRRAQALLLASEDKIKEIAQKVGFNDEYHFNRTFRKFAGMPPGKFRSNGSNINSID